MSESDPAAPGELATAPVAPPAADPFAELHAGFDDMFNNTVRIPGQDAWIILCGYNIGETSEFCALADAFVQQHGHGIILLVRPAHVAVARMYGHRFLKVLVLQDDIMQAVLRSNYIPQDRFEINKPMSACWIDRGFRHSDGVKYLGSHYPGRGGISETDMQRFVLRLPWNAKLEAPRIRVDWERAAMQQALDLGLRMGRSVLLCPINNSAKRFPQIFWDTVAARLIERGYMVFTNMGGLNEFNGIANMPIPGTTAVSLPIEQVIPFAHLAGRMITGGNGMSFLTMLGSWKTFRITQILPTTKDASFTTSSMGARSKHPSREASLISAFQYLSPELCIDAPLSEFLLPFDESDDEMVRLARVVADEDTSDPSYIERRECNGKRYIDEHAGWLRELTTAPEQAPGG
ncbi:hypothetical protein GCM10027277_32370 [Pseudoduganella ginsengisoli]|uniref:Uncharacterized protein n=1 Tax=Pseudoduganella ginsengisoli TaxID=1462440 RepID=A0A6L6PYL1_9BURK|nr:hypothetical protein [Pseudoduganella ginsengisoli]MTW02647.1 hypothetical protein [Pseudoduganella ginsengisoli]